MKILCMCQKGNSRSVALAWMLKKMKHDAIAVGFVTTRRSTRKLLYEWADLVIVLAPRYLHWIPDEYSSKVKVYDVGTDIWFKGFKKELVLKLQNFVDTLDCQ